MKVRESYDKLGFKRTLDVAIKSTLKGKKIVRKDRKYRTDKKIGMIGKIEKLLSRSQLQAKCFDFLDENRIIFVVLSGHFQRLGKEDRLAFCFDLNNIICTS